VIWNSYKNLNLRRNLGISWGHSFVKHILSNECCSAPLQEILFFFSSILSLRRELQTLKIKEKTLKLWKLSTSTRFNFLTKEYLYTNICKNTQILFNSYRKLHCNKMSNKKCLCHFFFSIKSRCKTVLCHAINKINSFQNIGAEKKLELGNCRNLRKHNREYLKQPRFLNEMVF